MKIIVDFKIENCKKICEVEMTQEMIEDCAKKFLAAKLQAYYRVENVEFGKIDIAGKVTTFREL